MPSHLDRAGRWSREQTAGTLGASSGLEERIQQPGPKKNSQGSPGCARMMLEAVELLRYGLEESPSAPSVREQQQTWYGSLVRRKVLDEEESSPRHQENRAANRFLVKFA